MDCKTNLEITTGFSEFDHSCRMETDWLPLQREVFEGLSSCSEALQVLRRAEKIGKIATGPGRFKATSNLLVLQGREWGE